VGQLALAVAAVLGPAGPSFAQGKSCEQLRAEVARKYEGGGIATPELQILAASAPSPGKVVGSCEMGSKKIVYLGSKGMAGGGSAAAPAGAKPADTRPPLLTECKDGSVSMGGSCKRN